MIFLGFISIIQIFLPGLIFTKLFYPTRTVTNLILSFGLGLLFNYQFVLLVTSLGLYNRFTTFLLFVVEIAVLTYLYLRKPGLHPGDEAATSSHGSASTMLELKGSWQKAFKYVFIGLVMVVSLEFLARIVDANPGIFDSGDDVVSWNRWAADWYNGVLPVHTWHYPQLIPANWSMMYQFIGTSEIQFFAKSIMSLFAIGILLIFVDLYRRSGSLFFLAALAFTGFLILKFVGGYIGRGYVDISVTFYWLSAFYVFYLGFNGVMPVRMNGVLLACMVAAAALTKQAGLFMILPLIVLLFYLLKSLHYPTTEKARIFLRVMVIASLLIAPWYIYKEWQIRKGVEESEVTWVTNDIYAGKGIGQRFIDGSAAFSRSITDFDVLKSFSVPGGEKLRVFLSVIFLMLASLSVFSFYGRISIFLVVIPYFLVWACFFSYDLRNVVPLLPFLGLSMGIGAIVAANLASRFFALPFGTSKKVVLVAIAFLLLILLSVRYDSNYLFTKEKQKAKALLGDAELNSRLYELYEAGDPRGDVLSGYLFLRYLPDIKKHYVGFNYTAEDLEKLKGIWEENKTSHALRYFLIHEGAATEIWEFVRQKQKEGELSQNLRSQAGWIIMETTH